MAPTIASTPRIRRSAPPPASGSAEALPKCQPVLLEPIHVVEIVCPSDATAKVNAILSARRGQILGFDSRESWAGWDCVRATMPEAEIGDLIVELRSATAGAGSFTRQFTDGRSHRPDRRPDYRRASGGGLGSCPKVGGPLGVRSFGGLLTMASARRCGRCARLRHEPDRGLRCGCTGDRTAALTGASACRFHRVPPDGRRVTRRDA